MGAIHLDALGFDIRVIFQGVVDDAAVVGVHRLEFDDVAPSADLFGGFLGFLSQFILLVKPVSSHVDLHLFRILIILKQQTIEDVLNDYVLCGLDEDTKNRIRSEAGI